MTSAYKSNIPRTRPNNPGPAESEHTVAVNKTIKIVNPAQITAMVNGT